MCPAERESTCRQARRVSNARAPARPVRAGTRGRSPSFREFLLHSERGYCEPSFQRLLYKSQCARQSIAGDGATHWQKFGTNIGSRCRHRGLCEACRTCNLSSQCRGRSEGKCILDRDAKSLGAQAKQCVSAHFAFARARVQEHRCVLYTFF